MSLTEEQQKALQAAIKAGARPVNLMSDLAESRKRNAARRALDSGGAKPARKRSQGAPSAGIEPSEHQEQVAVIQWWAIHCRRWGLDERLLFAVPNAGAGASKGQAGKMKAEGTRAGVPDLMLALPLHGVHSELSNGVTITWPEVLFHGMFIEMKRKGGKPTSEQAEYHYLLRSHDFNVVVAHGYDEAVRAITAYCDKATTPE